MNTQLRVAAVLFLVTTTSFLVANSLLESALASVTAFTALKNQVFIAAFLEVINSIGVFLIGVLLFSALYRHSLVIATAYLGFRLIESVLLSVGTMAVLLIAGSNSDLPNALATARAVHDLSFNTAMIFLGVGSIMLCFLLLSQKLVPLWLAILGLLGYCFLSLSVILELIGMPSSQVLFLPGALFEIIFPIWLLIKGFKQGDSA